MFEDGEYSPINLIFQNNIWKFLKLHKTALTKASDSGCTDIVKILFEQEGIDIKLKIFIIIFINFYFDYFVFQNNIWKFCKSHKTAFMLESEKSHTEIAQLFHLQKD